ncbi:hypothetical protein CDV55_101165 [Aspergillus turcosus]|uniref:Uncharacterized protein n=1 Tax=Aspergillus turcosus TaxID=1245748 RepID=A0A397I0M7_9EURO|nr:hypothetical protein CDV55_101165 [Aspergillus turcosus]RLM00395.1 hypothetical protein CFD26_108104 [Aspergillus turcosus]
MKWSTLLPLAISTLSLLPSTGAWEITWTDSDNKQHSQSGTGPSDCIVIDNPQGHLFKIDSQGEKGINMLLFTNNECRSKAAGMATDVFSKEASQDLLGFKVVALSSTTTTATATTGKIVPPLKHRVFDDYECSERKYLQCGSFERRHGQGARRYYLWIGGGTMGDLMGYYTHGMSDSGVTPGTSLSVAPSSILVYDYDHPYD